MNHTARRVVDSPYGPGTVTNWSYAGFPEVDGVAVAWVVWEDGTVFDPHGVKDKTTAPMHPRRAAALAGKQSPSAPPPA